MIDQVKHQDLYDQISDLKTQIIYRFSSVMGVASWLLVIWTLWPTSTPEIERINLRAIAFLLLFTCLSAYLIVRPLLLRELITVLGTLVAAIGLVFYSSQAESLLFFLVPITLAYCFHRQGLARIIIAFYVVFNIILVIQVQFFSFNNILMPSSIFVAVVVMMYTSVQRLFTLVDLSNLSIDIALRNQNHARERRAELVKTLKSLDTAQQTLRRTNYALQDARQRAEEARQLKQQFAQSISHELRTPLNLIIGFTESMIKTPEYYGQALPHKYSHDLSIVYRNALHLQNLVNDVLDLARIEASQMTMQFDAVQIHSFLTEIKEIAVGLTRRHNLAFKMEVDKSLPDTLWMDNVRIKQVLFNLLSNATRFTPSGHICLKVIHENANVKFLVEDTGIGIATENLGIIFEPFRQLENPMRRWVGGAGLGLSISQQLVKHHGSQLLVESELGKGSSFYFLLPIESTSQANTAIEIKPDSQVVNVDDVVLIVTDHSSTAVLFSRYIKSYRVVVVNGLDQLRNAMQQIIPQAIMFDRGCEELANFDIVHFANELLQPTTLISFSLSLNTQLSKHLDVTGYLTKPVLKQQLIDSLRLFESEVEHILVVDDDRDFVKLVTRMIDSSLREYRVSTAFNGHEVIAFLQQTMPDLILLDLEMPTMNGIQILQYIRSDDRYCDIPVIIMSAKEELEPYSAILSSIEVFRSPYLNQQEILRLIRTIIGR